MNADTIVKSILDYLQNSIKQKYYDFNQSMLKEDETYELKDPLICRHFIFKSFKELHKKFEKEKKDYWVEFNDDTYYYFDDLTFDYFKKHECILDNDFIDPFAFRLLKRALDSTIKKQTNDKELKIKHSFNKNHKLKIYEITVECEGINEKLKHIIIFLMYNNEH